MGADPLVSKEALLGQQLKAIGASIATAESCTGGLIAHRITNVPGSSAYFPGGVVTYSDQAKESLLGVPHQTLLKHGAVSWQTAVAMARGAVQQFRSTYGLSVTGIAGPGGGTPGKPVGLVYIALATPDDSYWKRFEWSGDREENKKQSAEAAIQLILDFLTDQCLV